MRSILVHIHDDDCLQARLQVALDLARQFDGHLTCLQAVPFEFGVPGDIYGTMAAQVAEDYRKLGDQLRDRIQAQLASEDVIWEWTDCNGAAAIQLPRYAPLNDIIILGAHNPVGKSQRPSALVSEVISHIQAPILVVPPNIAKMPLDVPAMVAWNGSAEGAHALKAAMPMLHRAASVHILTVSEEKDKERYDLPPTGAAKYLARHGIEAEIVNLPHEDDASIAEILVNATHIRKGGYLVMGAYGHSRFRESVLGGVTRDMLCDPEIPLLLSH
ncbi:universal stress protein [Altererythrobacter confluentis]|uniref:Universal stress protein n=1 Tax=Allopontixanthobacter confluentis TaxID=1849021 RepID=A0A6L7GCI1_9SPHN|nr:universal stress protein [Allopontixanthobacter confluentis]MXP13195.1 universal stress protein [Allopontixanthobacter confluentis]